MAEYVRHLKRGTEYEVLGEAQAQISTGDTLHGYDVRLLCDDEMMTVYRSLDDGQLWVRFSDEFRDGRFETVARASDERAQRENAKRSSPKDASVVGREAEAPVKTPNQSPDPEASKLRSDLEAAREERDEAQKLADQRLELMWMDPDAARGRAMIAEANLIALAKMYGEACGELQIYRVLAHDVAVERDDLVAEAAQPEAFKLREQLRESCMDHIARDLQDEQAWTEIAKLRDRVEKLEEALKPFAEAAEALEPGIAWEGYWAKDYAITVAYSALCAARTALSSSQTETRDA